MDEDKISKQEKQALRREKALLRHAKQSTYVKELMDDFEDRPEEVGGSLFLLIKIQLTTLSMLTCTESYL